MVQGDFHGHHAEGRLFRNLVTHQAVLAQIVGLGQGGPDHAEELALVVGLDILIFNSGGEDLLFELVGLRLILGVAGAELLVHRVAADHLEVADDGELLDLVEKHIALADGAGDHHPGQAGESGLVHRLGELTRLIDRGLLIGLAFPQDHACPSQGQHQPDGQGEAGPDLHV